MTDYTGPVEVAARAYVEKTGNMEWDLIPPHAKALVRETLLDAVVAAVDAARAEWEVELALGSFSSGE